MNGWCWHPPEELMRVYQARRVLDDRLLCALCGTFVYVLPGEPPLPLVAAAVIVQATP
jgi:hypothetical protein